MVELVIKTIHSVQMKSLEQQLIYRGQVDGRTFPYSPFFLGSYEITVITSGEGYAVVVPSDASGASGGIGAGYEVDFNASSISDSIIIPSSEIITPTSDIF
jgi:hypothetical protein